MYITARVCATFQGRYIIFLNIKRKTCELVESMALVSKMQLYKYS